MCICDFFPCDMKTTEKTQSNCKNVESNVLTDFFNLQRRARIQNLSNLTKKLPLRSLRVKILNNIHKKPKTIYHFSCKLPNFSYYISDFTYFCSKHLVIDIHAETASDHLSPGCCQPAHDVCCRIFSNFNKSAWKPHVI
jgi:hypothetical protein